VSKQLVLGLTVKAALSYGISLEIPACDRRTDGRTSRL